ncbi:hypothetical protein SRHO_G00317440 [Serrasalmus rhombeus]
MDVLLYQMARMLGVPWEEDRGRSLEDKQGTGPHLHHGLFKSLGCPSLIASISTVQWRLRGLWAGSASVSGARLNSHGQRTAAAQLG